jgi:hypothetical protein
VSVLLFPYAVVGAIEMTLAAGEGIVGIVEQGVVAFNALSSAHEKKTLALCLPAWFQIIGSKSVT